MSDWRNDFNSIYKLVKMHCSISDEEIAIAVGVSTESVRQYSSQRKTMPDNIDALCSLFETRINQLSDINQKALLSSIQSTIPFLSYDFRCDGIGQTISAMLKRCHVNEKMHSSYPYTESIRQNAATGHIQAVIFDFDGTLTNARSRTTWESLWEMLGYDVQKCRDLHRRYDRGEFSHDEWCELTAQKFIERNLTRQHLLELAKKIRLITGCRRTLQHLRERNILLYIVSGSIKDIIENVLGNAYSYFSDIQANEFVFDTQTSLLKKIVGTKYDFEGKSEYIQYIANRLEISPSDILFVGNSHNDIWAYQTGARTLCINPTHTNYHDNAVWHNVIVECSDLSEILKYIT